MPAGVRAKLSSMPADEAGWASEWLTGSIFDDAPESWQALQNMVAQVFSEMGYLNVQTPYKLVGVRTTKEVDVYAEDHSAMPPLQIVCECKYWESRVPQSVVLEFRVALEDSGMNRGFIISKAGFQLPGAHSAAYKTPVVLADFGQFQALFFYTWLKAMSIRLERSSRLLFNFAPMTWYDFAPQLSKDKIPALFDLQSKYEVLFSHPMGLTILDVHNTPVSCGITARNPSIFEPYKNLGIRTYRQFFDLLQGMVDQALCEFRLLFRITSEPRVTRLDTP